MLLCCEINFHQSQPTAATGLVVEPIGSNQEVTIRSVYTFCGATNSVQVVAHFEQTTMSQKNDGDVFN